VVLWYLGVFIHLGLEKFSWRRYYVIGEEIDA
jgi:hypothetical protein